MLPDVDIIDRGVGASSIHVHAKAAACEQAHDQPIADLRAVDAIPRGGQSRAGRGGERSAEGKASP
jgi:hypothetical protein